MSFILGIGIGIALYVIYRLVVLAIKNAKKNNDINTNQDDDHQE